MRLKLSIILIIELILASYVFAQKRQIDSLNTILTNTSSHDTVLVLSYLDMANYFYFENPDTAIILCKQAEEISVNVNYLHGKAQSYGWLGYLLEQKGEIPKALEYDKKCLKIQEELGLKEGIATSLNNIGYIYKRQGSISQAIKYYHKSMQIYKQIGDKKGLAMSLNNIAYIYDNQGDIEAALKYFHRSHKIYEEVGNQEGLAISFNNIGGVYRSQSDLKKAIEYYNKSLNISEEIGDKVGISTALNNLGLAYYDQENLEGALDLFSRSLKIYEEIGNKKGKAISLNNIGRIYKVQAEIGKAIEYCEKALAIEKEIGDKQGIAESYFNIGDIYFIDGKLDEAHKYATGCLNLSEELAYPKSIQKAAQLLSKIYAKQNKGIQALEMYKLYATMNDSILNQETRKVTFKQQARYDYEKQKAIDDIKHEKQIAIEQKEKDKQRIIIFATVLGLLLLIIFLFFVFNRLKITRKQKSIIEGQKKEVSEVNEELQLLNEDLNQQNEEITAQRDEIERQKEFVEEINFEINQSINYATRLQQSIFPEKNLLTKYLSEHFVLFKPKDKVSGDFYWWTHIENHTVITTADCTGHGVPGAFMSMLGTSFLREIVQKEYITHTGVILRKLRKEVVKALKQKGEIGEQKDGMDMAIISINHETNLLQFSGAYNPLYIIRKGSLNIEDKAVRLHEYPDLDYKLYEIKPDKMPIAIYDKMDVFTTHEIQLETGDQLYMFSDGYPDQFGGPKGKKFKYKPFKRLLIENANRNMQDQKKVLNTAFKNWKGYLEQVDDVVVLGIKI